MKMCKWCNRVWGDDVKVCKCSSMDFADVNGDWLEDWENENAPIKDGVAEAEWYQYHIIQILQTGVIGGLLSRPEDIIIK